MSYQVLARKWRPKSFPELVGQAHVKNTLINALNLGRLHHAYLFTGTRGVGKTTIARIFAKSLNCDLGVTASPCGECSACIDIERGNFIDLIEIDAASRTKVEDTREILDNVQYLPSRGRYKVYLIDEVHMLSRHSFNALLKTLEEPPPHVKFLLATTEGHKLPITILSRCLQFNLKALGRSEISTHLAKILQAENIEYDEQALSLLAKAADGSIRDALSLTDQAISQSSEANQSLRTANVQQMLGTLDRQWSIKLLAHIVNQNAEQALQTINEISVYAPDYPHLVDDLLALFHLAALVQLVPACAQLDEVNKVFVQRLAQKLNPQDVQLYYQLLLNGKKDLSLAPDPRMGFEMVMLRLLAFRPLQVAIDNPVQQPVAGSQAGLGAASGDLPGGDFTPASPDSDAAKKKQPFIAAIPKPTIPEQPIPKPPSVEVVQQPVGLEQNLEQDEGELLLVAQQQAIITAAQDQGFKPVLKPASQAETTLTREAAGQPSVNDPSIPQPIIPEPIIPELAVQPPTVDQPSVDSLADADYEDPIVAILANRNLVMASQFQAKPAAVSERQSPLANNKGSVVYERIPPQSQVGLHPEPQPQPEPQPTVANSHTTEIAELAEEPPVAQQPPEWPDSVDDEQPDPQQSPTDDFGYFEMQQQFDSVFQPADVATPNDPQPSEPQPKGLAADRSHEPSFAATSISATSANTTGQDAAPASNGSGIARWASQVDEWAALIAQMPLGGRERIIAVHSVWQKQQQQVKLLVQQGQSHLYNQNLHQQLQQAISTVLNEHITLTVEFTQQAQQTPFVVQQDIDIKRLAYAKQMTYQDPIIMTLQQEFGATIDDGSICPAD